MNDPMAALLVLASYLIGAIPFGLLIVRRLGGGDIRQQGSGNIGATNVLRTVGKKAGAAALLLDMAKGGIPVLACQMLYGPTSQLTLLCGLAAFLGHLYPVYLGFKGGKGVATALGVLMAWSPAAAALTLLLWLISAKGFKISSLAALIAFAALPLVLFLLGEPTDLLWASGVLTPLVFWRHRANIQRLLAGTEPRIGRKSGAS
ncbi:MAG: glycerol-3-phosphate 1-O-acyltransferase PlsY [Magnetococcales bacterium]|nr:glycerol-3-phosphate 1-O-acyltransferase PlsY [Magnetococcales bacterium]